MTNAPAITNGDEALTENQQQVLRDQAFRQRMVSGVFDAITTLLGQAYNRSLIHQMRYPHIDQHVLESQYRTGDIANRIGKTWPEYCWADEPEITDTPDTDNDKNLTPFEEDIKILFAKHGLLGWMRKLDEILAYADYGAMRIQLADGTMPDEPAQLIRNAGPHNLTYITIHSAYNAQFTRNMIDKDPNSSNYGRPEFYRLRAAHTNRALTHGASLNTKNSIQVHYSKIVHAAEGLDENTIIGFPRLMAVAYKLHDMLKISASSAEAFYQGARNPTIGVINSMAKVATQTGSGMSKDEQDKFARALRAMNEEFVDSVVVKNGEVKSLNPNIASPKDAGDLVFRLLSSASGIPKEILEGNVIGLRGGEANSNMFGKAVEIRQRNFCAPEIIRPIIQNLIDRGGVRPPKNDLWEIKWKPVVQESNKDKMQAFNQFASGAKSLGHTATNPIFTNKQIAEKAGEDYLEEELAAQAEKAQAKADERMKAAQDAMGAPNGAGGDVDDVDDSKSPSPVPPNNADTEGDK